MTTLSVLNRSQKQVLLALALEGSASWAWLVDHQDASLPEFHAALEGLRNEGLVVASATGIGLTEAGRERLASLVEAPPLSLQCAACESKGYAVAPGDARLVELERLLEGRPGPNFDYDQGAITPADSLLRAAFMEERGDLAGANILFVGDFDLMSVALAMTRQPARVVVIDIDTRVIDFVNGLAAREGLRLEARPFDVRDPLPEALLGQFDIFLCDPVETLPGIQLYLSRGSSALKGTGSAAYVGLTTLEASRKKWYDIQGVLYEMGFAVTDIRRRFSGYPDHDEPPTDPSFTYPIIEQMAGLDIGHRWYTSAFVRVEAVRPPTPIVTGHSELGDDLYVDDEAWATPRRN